LDLTLCKSWGTFEGVSERAVRLHAFFLELAGLMLVEAALSIAAIGEVCALNNNSTIKKIGEAVYFVLFYH
jgi:hypothetical protein